MASPADPGLTDDRLLGGRLRLEQPRHGYRVAIDPVLLAAAVAAEDGARVLDAGAGTGAAALCLAARVAGCRITGLERDPELLSVARRNVAGNGMGRRIDLCPGDLLDAPAELRAMPFDCVMTNPPYHAEAAASPPASPTGRAAHLATTDIAAWIAACLARLRPQGRLFLIHPADRLDAILAALSGRAGDLVVLPLWPRADAQAARRVIVAARKGRRGPLRLARGLVLHEPDGRFTAAAEAILRDAAPLPL